MGRSRRLAVDDSNAWLLRADYLADPEAGPDGTIDHGDADYVVFAFDGSGDEAFTIEPGLYGSLTDAFLTFVVWGKGVVSFGPPTAEQIAFMADAGAASDLGAFPGPFLHAGYTDPAATDIYVGIRDPETTAGLGQFTVIKFGESTITIYRDQIVFSNGAGVVDLGTGVRLTAAEAESGAWRLASLIRVNGTDADNVMAGTAAPQTIHGLGGHDTITAGTGPTDIYGDAGNDRITGYIGKDRLYGGSGNDTIKGGFGDSLYGGIGNDQLIADRAATVSGGTGTDRLHLDFTGLGLVFDVTLPNGTSGTIASIGTSYTGIERIDLSGGYNNDRLFGNRGDNVINGGAGADVINGGAGNDRIDAGVGGAAPELPVEAISADFATAIAIDKAFSEVPGASPKAEIVFPEAPFSATDSYYSFDVSEGGDLLVSNTEFLPLSPGFSLTLFDANENLIATNAFDDPLEVIDLAAGRYVLRITSQSDEGFSKIAYVDVSLSGATTQQRRNVLAGGTGDDTFLVHAATDRITEKPGEGTDTVIADLDWTLGSNLENLTLKAGAGAINGIGNTAANTIIGNEDANRLNGSDGNDTLIGGAGNDDLRGDAGADRMEGGLGDDIYRVSNRGDLPVERAGQGTDTVYVTFSYVLPENIEAVILNGTASLDAAGNALANTLTGNSGDNVLDGGAGIDTMLGGAGNDTYLVDHRGDRVFETVTADSPVDAGGRDTVRSLVTYSLAVAGRQFVENLDLLGTGAINAVGNGLGNVINGNSGNNTLTGKEGSDRLSGFGGNDRLEGGSGGDVLVGGSGNDRLLPGSGIDTLSGNAGADVFIFTPDAVLDARSEAAADRITDFSHAEGDRIDVRLVDANLLLAGDQAFTFIGKAAFTGSAGELRVKAGADGTWLVGDVNGDGIGDGYIRLAPGLALVAADFLL